MKTVMRLATIATGFALGSILGPHAAHASGDAPWCAITQVGDGDGQWDCQYETVDECVPHVLAGNRGNCSPNPYYSPPSAAAVFPGNGPTNTTPGVVENRKSQKAKLMSTNHQNCDCRRRLGDGRDVRRFRQSCV
jgi:hypothetical protein